MEYVVLLICADVRSHNYDVDKMILYNSTNDAGSFIVRKY